DDLPTIIHPVNPTRIATESAQIGELSFAPEEGMENFVSCQSRHSYNLASLIKSGDFCTRTAQRSHIEHVHVLPEEWVDAGRASVRVDRVGVRSPRDLACIVD